MADSKPLTFQAHCNLCSRDFEFRKNNAHDFAKLCIFCGSTQLYMQPVLPSAKDFDRSEGVYCSWIDSCDRIVQDMLRVERVNGDCSVSVVQLTYDEAQQVAASIGAKQPKVESVEEQLRPATPCFPTRGTPCK